jgi:hypothetical protein
MGRDGTGQGVPVIGFFALELIVGGRQFDNWRIGENKTPKKQTIPGKITERDGKEGGVGCYSFGCGSLGFFFYVGRAFVVRQLVRKIERAKNSFILQERPERDRIPGIQTVHERYRCLFLCHAPVSTVQASWVLARYPCC